MPNRAAYISNYRGGVDAKCVPSPQLWRSMKRFQHAGTDGLQAAWFPLAAASNLRTPEVFSSHIEVSTQTELVICYVLAGFLFLDRKEHGALWKLVSHA